LIAGLGNPGPDYLDTRHNLGFRVVERLAQVLGARPLDAACHCLLEAAGDLLLCRPQTYMNRSGWALRCLAERHGLEPGAVLVVYDDVALPLGRLRARARGGPGGHRGMESVIENLRTEEVPRLRLGIGGGEAAAAPPSDLAEFVLAPFADEEAARVAELVERATEAARLWVEEGIGPVMNRYNAPLPPDGLPGEAGKG